jgi:hypothetical protein
VIVCCLRHARGVPAVRGSRAVPVQGHRLRAERAADLPRGGASDAVAAVFVVGGEAAELIAGGLGGLRAVLGGDVAGAGPPPDKVCLSVLDRRPVFKGGCAVNPQAGRERGYQLPLPGFWRAGPLICSADSLATGPDQVLYRPVRVGVDRNLHQQSGLRVVNRVQRGLQEAQRLTATGPEFHRASGEVIHSLADPPRFEFREVGTQDSVKLSSPVGAGA